MKSELIEDMLIIEEKLNPSLFMAGPYLSADCLACRGHLMMTQLHVRSS